MKYFSMFTGIGGFELGIEKATNNKWKCIGYSEIDKYAIKIFKKHYPNTKNYGDATTINTKDLPDFNLLCAGFPCQAFSVAGRRKGFEEARGTLFFEIARIIKDKRPNILFLENVKGLLSHSNGDTFRTILRTLDELGYDAEWQVLNSKNFGVPQNRERVFIIGHLRGTGFRKVFPIESKTSGTFRLFQRKDKEFGLMQEKCIYKKKGIAPTLTKNSSNQILIEDKRTLSIKECERLQGFPDDWTKYGIDKTKIIIPESQRYKCLGNAVTINVIEAIIKKMVKTWQ